MICAACRSGAHRRCEDYSRQLLYRSCYCQHRQGHPAAGSVPPAEGERAEPLSSEGAR